LVHRLLWTEWITVEHSAKLLRHQVKGAPHASQPPAPGTERLDARSDPVSRGCISAELGPGTFLGLLLTHSLWLKVDWRAGYSPVSINVYDALYSSDVGCCIGTKALLCSLALFQRERERERESFLFLLKFKPLFTRSLSDPNPLPQQYDSLFSLFSLYLTIWTDFDIFFLIFWHWHRNIFWENLEFIRV